MAKNASRTRKTDKKKGRSGRDAAQDAFGYGICSCRMCNLPSANRVKRNCVYTNRRTARRAFPRRTRVCWYVNRRAKRDPASNDPNAGRLCSPTCCSRCTTPPPSARSRICNGPSKASVTQLITRLITHSRERNEKNGISFHLAILENDWQYFSYRKRYRS